MRRGGSRRAGGVEEGRAGSARVEQRRGASRMVEKRRGGSRSVEERQTTPNGRPVNNTLICCPRPQAAAGGIQSFILAFCVQEWGVGSLLTRGTLTGSRVACGV